MMNPKAMSQVRLGDMHLALQRTRSSAVRANDRRPVLLPDIVFYARRRNLNV